MGQAITKSMWVSMLVDSSSAFTRIGRKTLVLPQIIHEAADEFEFDPRPGDSSRSTSWFRNTPNLRRPKPRPPASPKTEAPLKLDPVPVVPVRNRFNTGWCPSTTRGPMPYSHLRRRGAPSLCAQGTVPPPQVLKRPFSSSRAVSYLNPTPE